MSKIIAESTGNGFGAVHMVFSSTGHCPDGADSRTESVGPKAFTLACGLRESLNNTVH